ncbi:MAG: tetratricopeptide repeat protein [Alphaproteobacteria bacterium]|nr:tetratricopeptide repeat protein [Alphaproteobacteria bacterium]
MITSRHHSLQSFLGALAVSCLLVFSVTAAKAMGSGGSDIEDAELAIEEGDFEAAADLLRTVLEDDPDNADAYNYLAYSQRNMGQTDEAMENYARALELDPEHKGALEYQGELYLKLGNKAGADANLARLGALCPRGCDEHEVLQAAIERFKDGNLSWTPSFRRRTTGE